MPKPQFRFDPSFNMSSMTDIVFLLLIFFMLTSNFVTPSAVKIDLPSSKSGGTVLPKLSITITDDGKFYLNKQEVAIENIKDELKVILMNAGDKHLTLYTAKNTPIQDIIKVMDIAYDLGIDVQLAVTRD